MLLPGSNLLLVGGLFLAGWLSGRNGFNRNEPEYLEHVTAQQKAVQEVQAKPLPADAAAGDAHAEQGKKDA
jgi:hypothetical protein